MIHVRNLTKYYGDYAAVQDVSFDVARGQVVGFLGPNGAGKTTTMRILTGFLTATSGQAQINGYNVFWSPLEVRRSIGYMPENCPLYTEMRVHEYLEFRAGVKGLSGSSRRSRLDYVITRCWLTDVRRQLIGTLSKGYRQRVGLADALVADPPVLILDEPTAGLDPTQIRSTRKLIRELGQEHTILLSTHILPEVEMTCDSVIIIHQGRVVASSPIRDLARQTGGTMLIVEMEGKCEIAPIKALPGVTNVERKSSDGGTRLRIACANPAQVSPAVCALAVQNSWNLRELRTEQFTLEDLFVQITGEESAEEVVATP